MRSKLNLLLFVASCLLFTSTAFADSQARIVRLSYLEGNVELDRGDGNGYIRAFLNMPLIEGANLWTHADARAEVEFEDGSTARLTPNTIINFTQLRLANDGSKLSTLNLADGVVYFNIKHHDDDLFRVTAGAREVMLEKTSQFRVVHSARQDPFELRVAVFKGEVQFIGENNQRVGIRKNETLTLDFGDSGRYFLARGIVEEAHDYWNRERDDERVQMARRDSGSTNLVYVSDLHRHGSFITVVGFGRVWRPFAVSINWDPFAMGQWVYYPGAGYIWVSDYPWGWTPYRYGSWVHVRSHGWCWRPSHTYTTWARGPVIVNPPTGYVAPVVPAVNEDRRTRGVVRVGRQIDPNGITDSPTGSVSPAIRPTVLIQDRVRGLVEVDDRRRPDGQPERWTGRRKAEDGVVDLPSGGSGVVTDGSQRVTGYGSVKGRPRGEGEIGTQRVIETPVINDAPQTGGGTQQPVTPIERTRRPSRHDEDSITPVRPTRVETPPASPVITDRSPRPPRHEQPVSPPPQRISPPPVQPSPPPQRASPPPQPAPERTQPRIDRKDPPQ